MLAREITAELQDIRDAMRPGDSGSAARSLSSWVAISPSVSHHSEVAQ